MTHQHIQVGMKPTHPGVFLLEEVLKPHGLSVTAAARVLGVRRATLSDLLNGKAALTPEMALRFDKAFGVSLDTLLRMQAWHDSVAIRERFGEIDVQRYVPDAGVA